MKEDNIDVRLGELVNDYPSRTRIKSNFIRESRANYKYGTKKLTVSIENNKVYRKYFIKVVKTGNLLLSFDDFIDKFGNETLSNEKGN